MTESRVWYQDGLRFRCTQCGNCCSGNPGFVWVNEADVQAIAEFRGISIGEMRINHTRLTGAGTTLREFANGDCTFLNPETRKCSVYPVRPAQCGTWPFWNSNLESPETWNRAKTVCPGMDQGELVQLESIRKQADVIDI